MIPVDHAAKYFQFHVISSVIDLISCQKLSIIHYQPNKIVKFNSADEFYENDFLASRKFMPLNVINVSIDVFHMNREKLKVNILPTNLFKNKF